MSTDINFSFIPFVRNYEDRSIEMKGAAQLLVCPEEVYTSISENVAGSNVLHLEFTATREVDKAKLNALLAIHNISSQLITVNIDDMKFSGIIKRARISKAITVFEQPDENDQLYSVDAMRVVMLVLEIEEDIWQKIVG